MTFVILQAPNDGYYWLIKAASDKHFELLDSGFDEIDNGEYYDIREKLDMLEWAYQTENGRYEVMKLRNKQTGGYSYHREDELHRILAINPDFLNDKEVL